MRWRLLIGAEVWRAYPTVPPSARRPDVIFGRADRSLAVVEILGTRAKNQPAPARFVHEALSEPNRDPARQWLTLLDDETVPAIVESEGHSLVIWSSIWLKRPEAQVRFDIEAAGQGCDLRWTLLDVDDPGPALVGHMCKRLNQLINAELRYSFGQ